MRQRNCDQPLLAREHLDLAQDYLELQRLRVAVKKAEIQQLKRKESRRRGANHDDLLHTSLLSSK